jgi:SWI/SNF-related matrix-associated actin-dependent regulator 1 of chromatin subfamily A
MSELPLYLDDPRVVDGRTYGTLSLDGARWRIKGEPQVVQLAKRLFPGSTAQRGEAVFPVSRRMIGDLNWLMQRYPLAIAQPAEWAAALGASREHVRHTYEIRRRPEHVTPPAGRFVGTLMPFQERGVAFLQHHRRALLADDMGLGKTVQALATLASIDPGEAFPALIVAQPHMVKQWERAVARFVPHLSQLTVRGTKAESMIWPHVTIVHYGLLSHWRWPMAEQFRSIVFDEIQELRHNDSKKYNAASTLGDGANYVFGLSGTPIHNAGGEIWNVLNIIETHCLGDRHSFQREWCTGYQSEVVEDPELLGARLRDEGLMLRRTKDEVLPDLPDKRRVVQEIDADGSVFASLIGEAVKLLPELDAAERPFEKGKLLLEVTRIARQATGTAKARHVAAFVAAMLQTGEPGVVFAYHHDVFDILSSSLRDQRVVEISGRRTTEEKATSLAAMVDGDADCALISLRTTAGIDGLQKRCRWCVFAELDWSPAVHTQAEDRLHRIGLPDSVLAYYLVWSGEGSTDPDVMSRLGFKASQFVGLMGDKPEADDGLATTKATEHMRAVVERLRELSAKGGVR